MTATACVLIHPHALRDRWIGDVRATYCDECDSLYLPAPTPRRASVELAIPPVSHPVRVWAPAPYSAVPPGG